MTEVELLNEIKRLADVTSELEEENANLSDVIAELQTVNSNLLSELSELTAINSKLVEVNIRNLEKKDIPQIGLPYDLVHVYAYPDADLVDGDNTTLTFQASGGGSGTNWGSGKDFYPMWMNFYLKPGDNEKIFMKMTEGLIIELYEDDGAGIVTFFKKTYNYNNITHYSRTRTLASAVEKIYGNKVNYTNTLNVKIENYTGKTLYTPFGIYIIISGIAITPS